MMQTRAIVVQQAVALFLAPAQVHVARRQPLPEHIHFLLRILARDQDALREAAAATQRAPDLISQAVQFFVEQVLLSDTSDSFRILGGDRQTPTAELRRNMSLLMQWLHPDREGNASQSLYVSRATKAWEDLKTEQRRAAYEASTLSAATLSNSRTRKKKSSIARLKRRKSSAAPRLGLSTLRRWLGI